MHYMSDQIGGNFHAAHHPVPANVLHGAHCSAGCQQCTHRHYQCGRITVEPQQMPGNTRKTASLCKQLMQSMHAAYDTYECTQSTLPLNRLPCQLRKLHLHTTTTVCPRLPVATCRISFTLTRPCDMRHNQRVTSNMSLHFEPHSNTYSLNFIKSETKQIQKSSQFMHVAHDPYMCTQLTLPYGNLFNTCMPAL